jgi:regulator of sirC expression with transglutaminase-like and TPR domain
MSSNQASEIKALIDLLDDPDEKIFERVKDKLLAIGSEAIPLLEECWENTFDNTIQHRIENVIHGIQFAHTYNELNKWLHFYTEDLLSGYLIVTAYQFPEIDPDELRQKVEQIKWDVWLELNDSLTALEIVRVVNHVFYDLHKFSSNKLNPNAIQNYFLNNLIETHRGNPLSMGILYLILAQKLNIPIYGVDLPEHFVLAYTSEIREGDRIIRKDKKDVMFYINPFKRGTIFSKKEVEIYLTQLKIDPDPAFFLPCDNVAIIRRLISSLITTYKFFNLEEKVKELEMLAALFKIA